jgi:ABC-2 type transport system permease protein
MNTLSAPPLSSPVVSRAATPSNRLLPAVWKLIRLRFLIGWNTFKHAKIGRKIFTVFAYLMLLGFGAGICVISWLLLKFLRSPSLQQYVGLDVSSFLQAMPVLIFALLFLTILLTSFGVLLQALYLSGDTDFLLTSPVPIRAVFMAKLLQAVLPNFGLFALFGLPVLFGLGFSEGYNFLYYPLVLLIMIALTLAAAGLSALLVMLVVRVLPPRRAAEILGFIGATLGLVCGQLGNIYNGFGRNTNISSTQANTLFTTIMRMNTPFSPLNWAGQGLVALGEGRWLTGLLLVALTLGLASVAFMFALATAERWYYTGWAGMQVVARKKKKAPRAQPSPLQVAVETSPLAAAVSVPLLQRVLPHPVWAVVWKDFLVYRRDLRNMSQLISPLILGVIYTLMIFRTGGRFPTDASNGMPAILNQSFSLLIAYGSVGMSLFVGWMLLSRLSGMAFSAEGKNYWILKASPVRTGQLLTAKFIVGYLPSFVLGLLFLIAIAFMQKLTAGPFLYSVLAMSACLAGVNGMQLGFGAAGARLTWDDPRKMNAGTIGCLGQIITMVFVPLTFGVFIGPLLLVSFFHWPMIFGYVGGGLVGIAVNGVAAILPPWLAKNKIERLGEEAEGSTRKPRKVAKAK